MSELAKVEPGSISTLAQPSPVTIRQDPPTAFSSAADFETAQRMAAALCSSDIVPQTYRGRAKIGNCLIALEMAQRTGAGVLAVMQSLYVVHGNPSFAAQFLIAAANTSGKFATPIRYALTGEPETAGRTCTAWAIDHTGQRLEGTPVSIQMAIDEGWYHRKAKDGGAASKWPTMAEQMLRYRAATFFVRIYAPEIAMGMQTAEEVEDVGPQHVTDVTPPATDVAALNAALQAPPAVAVDDSTAAPASRPEPGPREQAATTASGAAPSHHAEAAPPAACEHPEASIKVGAGGRVCGACGEALPAQPAAAAPVSTSPASTEAPKSNTQASAAALTADAVLADLRAATTVDQYELAVDLVRTFRRGSRNRNRLDDAAADTRRRLRIGE